MIPIKNAKEIEKMRQACRTASDILDRVSDLIRPGITTKEVDEAAADFMSDAHVKSAFLGYRLGHRVFPGNICISLNDEVVHGIGSQRRIQYGDIVKLDIGIVQDGWVGDNATTVPVGIIDERTDQLLRVTENALARAISAGREGSASVTFALKLRMKRAALVFQSYANSLDTGLDEKCTRSRRFPTTASAAADRS